MDNEAMEKDPLVVRLNGIRKAIKDLASEVKLTKANLTAVALAPAEDRGEVVANVTLAYRHLEDASMRIGKAIQARDGGVSVYDKATTVGA